MPSADSPTSPLLSRREAPVLHLQVALWINSSPACRNTPSPAEQSHLLIDRMRLALQIKNLTPPYVY
jgi:hypothetical protein